MFHPYIGMAQSDAVALAQLKNFARNVHAFNRVLPQEKVYLHFDNTEYYRGETIWFKAYVIRTDSSCYTNLSRVLYVELIAPTGDIVETKKLKIENGQAHGEFSLDRPLIDNGWYEVRAYTRYMTNWDAAGIFSRVFPVRGILKHAEKQGKVYLSNPRKAKESETALQQWFQNSQPDFLDHLRFQTSTKKQKKSKGHNFSINFYPESGHLLKSISTKMAFGITSTDLTNPVPSHGTLVSDNGDTITQVPINRDGRGIIDYTPKEHPRKMALRDKRGEIQYIPLPEPEDSGCQIAIDATTNSEQIQITFRSTPHHYGKKLGWTLLHNGNVLRFDTLKLYEYPHEEKLQQSSLLPGVNQLTLFDANGKIMAERLFFVYPNPNTDIENIYITPPDTIRPYNKLTFIVQAQPEHIFSLAIRDAGQSEQRASTEDISSWLLLSSDLKGYISHPKYYLECNDKEHREATDLLMMIQGWRRYDWMTMAGKKTFVKQQPIEDGLYIDGQIISPKDAHKCSKLSLDILLMSPKHTKWKWISGQTYTDDNGYYAFRVEDDIEDEWGLVFNTKKENVPQNFRVLINRHFSPELKELTYEETHFLQTDTQFIDVISPLYEPFDSTVFSQQNFKNRALQEVVVKDKKKKKKEFTKTERDLKKETYMDSMSVIYYNVTRNIDDLLDQGYDIPPTSTWINDKKYIRHIMKEENRYFQAYVVGMAATGLHDQLNDILPNFVRNLEDVRSIYIQIPRGNERRIIRHPIQTTHSHTATIPTLSTQFTYDQSRAIYAFIFPRYTFPLKKKGIRQTYFQGYNRPQVFQMNDYSVMPPDENDHRRTLYWIPNVATDSTGQACVTLWNSADCRKLIISAESITPDGKPMLYKKQ